MTDNKACTADIAIDALSYRLWLEERSAESAAPKGNISLIVRRAASRELTDEQQELLRLHWSMGMSAAEIARLSGENRTTVLRRIYKVRQILYDKLQYAVELHYGANGQQLLSEALENGLQQKNAPKSGCKSCGERIKLLRAASKLNVHELSIRTGIAEERINTLEKNGMSISLEELITFAAFFSVSTDYLVYGTQAS